MDQIQNLADPPGVNGRRSTGNPKPVSNETPFGEIIRRSVAEVNRLQGDADKAVQELNTARNKDIHGTLIAMEKADISFQLLMQVRNKIIAAYQEIMRMQI